jgi:hypothetical protein
LGKFGLRVVFILVVDGDARYFYIKVTLNIYWVSITGGFSIGQGVAHYGSFFVRGLETLFYKNGGFR